ncbi:uncharacterized protein LOC134529282 [Bacillus rossius redtenbacheri]|uniref:uncharacterized protein LOC134529282 n=1 Tax=Bacillus rossius redtenbacheri TaxID=93214 RepID=UPI002FDEB55D
MSSARGRQAATRDRRPRDSPITPSPAKARILQRSNSVKRRALLVTKEVFRQHSTELQEMKPTRLLQESKPGTPLGLREDLSQKQGKQSRTLATFKEEMFKELQKFQDRKPLSLLNVKEDPQKKLIQKQKTIKIQEDHPLKNMVGEYALTRDWQRLSAGLKTALPRGSPAHSHLLVACSLPEAPLKFACSHDLAALVSLLLEAGLPPGTLVDGAGNTMLHAAAAGGRARLVEELLARGADPGALNARRQTPLDKALGMMHAGVVRLLAEHGGPRGPRS